MSSQRHTLLIFPDHTGLPDSRSEAATTALEILELQQDEQKSCYSGKKKGHTLKNSCVLSSSCDPPHRRILTYRPSSFWISPHYPCWKQHTIKDLGFLAFSLAGVSCITP
jgi:hypothetical protein